VLVPSVFSMISITKIQCYSLHYFYPSLHRLLGELKDRLSRVATVLYKTPWKQYIVRVTMWYKVYDLSLV